MTKPKTLTEVRYLHNQVLKSAIPGRYYFAKKVRLLPSGLCEVWGQKADVTESVEALLKADRAARSKKAKHR